MKVKNPSTGNFEEVYVKALDSLPVGTEVDFTGSVSDIPVGWEQVNSYSTSEVNTGKTWIDGKPIYRRVIQTTTPSAVSSSQATQIYAFTESVNEIVNLYGWLTNVGASSNVERMSINNYYVSGNVISTYVTLDNKIMMKVELARYTARPVNIVVEYTKTTD